MTNVDAKRVEPTLSDVIRYPIRYSATRVFTPDTRKLEQHRVIHPGTPAPILQSYKLLRTQVVNKLQNNHWNSLGILAARSGEGASLTAINLAISLAMDPRVTVLLVDLNLREPSIHRYFGFEPEFGLLDVISQNAALTDVLFNPGIDSLLVIPGTEKVEYSSEFLASPAISQFVEEIKSRYQSRIVIFDLPPVLEADDAMAFASNIDAGLVVICDGKTHEQDLERMSELLQHLPVLGTVYNDAPD